MRYERPDTIVLIHGPWLTSRSWAPWADRYAAHGFRVLVPPWPGLDHAAQVLRADPSPIAAVTVDRLVDHYERLVLDQERPPIVMGHSCGGTMAQILLDRGLGAVGVGVASPPLAGSGRLRIPMGDTGGTGAIDVDAAAGGVAVRNGVIALDPREFHRAFAHTLSRPESDELYRRYCVPAPAAVMAGDAFAEYRPRVRTEVEADRDARAPLLLIAFGEDRVVPPSAVRELAEDVTASASITEWVEFPGRPHVLLATGWEQVADYAAVWSVEHARVPLWEEHSQQEQL